MNDEKKVINDFKTEENSYSSLSYQVEPLTNHTSIIPNTIKSGLLVVKLPVVLAEVNIAIPVEDTVTLDKEVLEINSIRKSVFLTHSRIVPFSEGNSKDNGILYVEGFIKKNIEYAVKTYTPSGTPNTCGYIRYSIFEVPFSFTTKINFIRELIFTENIIPCEVEFFKDKEKEIGSSDECLDSMIRESTCMKNSTFTQFFNEEPFTELVKAEIVEIDISINETSNSTTATEQVFTKVTEKVALNLTLNILQKQQVRITAE